MHPTLFHIPNRLFGVDVFGFGLLLAVWAVASVLLVAWLVRRQGFSADTLGYLPLLALIGATIAFLLPHLTDARGLPVRGYGVMVVAAIAAGRELGVRLARRMGLDHELLYSLTFWMLIPGVIGGRLFYVIQYWPQYQSQAGLARLLEIANLAEGGLVVYGACVGVLAGVLGFLYVHRLPFLPLADLVVPACALAMGIGRIGCFLSGCCYGGPTDLPWGVRFPQGSPAFLRQVELGQLPLEGLYLPGPSNGPPLIAGVAPDSPAARAGVAAGQRIERIDRFDVSAQGTARAVLAGIDAQGTPIALSLAGRRQPLVLASLGPARSLKVHPTQLYSAIDGILIAAVLTAWLPFRRRDGELLVGFLALYGVTRFLEEVIRTDEPAVLQTGLTISQNISILVLAIACGLWFYIRRRPPRVTHFAHGRGAGQPRRARPAATT